MAPPSRKADILALLPADVTDKDWANGTVENLQKRIDLQEAAIRRNLRQMRELELVHIGRWRRTKGLPAAVWIKGKGDDAPMLGPKTQAHYCKKHRAQVKKAVERARTGKRHDDRYSGRVAIALANDTAQRTRINPQHWFSALGL
jgi:hypothetical protein